MMDLLQQQKTFNTLPTSSFSLSLDQVQLSPWQENTTEFLQVDWLILHFNAWFSHHNVKLVRGDFEPEYFPASLTESAKIQFAHGFFNSALHEISHWTIAGKERRQLSDLGYWYAPDGRTQAQQALFEKVEIKPQAIEWLFAQAFGRKFHVSLDNLTGQSNNGNTFKDAIYQQIQCYFKGEQHLPSDAAHFIHCICQCVRNGKKLQAHEFLRENLD